MYPPSPYLDKEPQYLKGLVAMTVIRSDSRRMLYAKSTDYFRRAGHIKREEEERGLFDTGGRSQ